MKRLLCILLAVALMLPLTACGKHNDRNEVEMPVIMSGEDTGRRTLTVGMPASAAVTDYVDNYFTRMMEQRLDMQLRFVLFSPDAQVRAQQLEAMVDDGQPLPDILLGMSLSKDDVAHYGERGDLMDLAPYFDNPNWEPANRYGWHEKMWEYAGEAARRLALTKSRDGQGHMYYWPSACPVEDDLPVALPFINRSWLDKLGLSMPGTWDELVEVLRAFKSKDPNGNGLADEIPMLGSVKLDYADAPLWLMNCFGVYVYDSTLLAYDREGQISLPYAAPEYREGLRQLNMLVEEGLLASVTWSMKEKAELTALWTPGSGVTTVGVLFGDPTAYTTPGDETLCEYVPLPQPQGSYVPQKTKAVNTNCHITTACVDFDLAVEFLMSFCDLDVMRAVRYGEEGVDWAEQTDLQSGKPMVQVLAPASGDTGNKAWHISGPAVCFHGEGSPIDVGVFEDAPVQEETVLTYREELLARAKHGQLDHAGQYNPPLFYHAAYNEEELDSNGNSLAELKVYVKEARAKFAVGQMDVNSDEVWQDYLATLERLGMNTLLENTRAALERRSGM